MGEELLSVFGNKMLRRISGHKKDEVTEEYYTVKTFVISTFIWYC
jgi:hypothetical protein